jgi:hypothetical protein
MLVHKRGTLCEILSPLTMARIQLVKSSADQRDGPCFSLGNAARLERPAGNEAATPNYLAVLKTLAIYFLPHSDIKTCSELRTLFLDQRLIDVSRWKVSIRLEH